METPGRSRILRFLRHLVPARFREQALGDLEEAHNLRRRRGWAPWKAQAALLVGLVRVALGCRWTALRLWWWDGGPGHVVTGVGGLPSSLWQDLRFSARTLTRSPMFTAVALATIALGVGASSAIFSVVNGVLLRPLPYPDADRIAVLYETDPMGMRTTHWLGPDDYLDLRERNQTLELIGTYQWVSLTYTGGSEPLRLRGQMVTEDVLPILGTRVAYGRTFSAREYVADDSGGAELLLEYGFWERVWGSDPSVVGRSMILDDKSYTIVGVLEKGWYGFEGRKVDVVIPRSWRHGERRQGGNWIRVVARRRPGVDLSAVRADLSSIGEALRIEYPRTNHDHNVTAISVQDHVFGSSRLQLQLFLASAGLVLLIACVNLVNMTVGRSFTRAHELGVRISLGAGRARIFRQLLVESLSLSCVGGLLGSAVALAALQIFLRQWPAQLLPRMDEIGVDGTVLAFAALVSLASGLVFGALPAVARSRSGLENYMTRGARSTVGGRTRRRVRNGLIVAEVGLAVMLLIGSGLLLRSLQALEGQDPGFEKENRLAFTVPTPEITYPTEADLNAYVASATERLSAIPGVQSVAASPSLPMRGGWDSGTWTVELVDRPSLPEDQRSVQLYRVTDAYLETMGIPVIAGRAFTSYDGRGDSRVALVSESFAALYYPGEDPLGKQITVGLRSPQLVRIVGVVGNVQHTRLGQTALPQVYEPLAQRDRAFPTLMFVLRSSVPPKALLDPVRSAVHSLDPDQPLVGVETFEQLVSDQTAMLRFRATIMLGFGGASLLLAVVGLYGVLSLVVAQRNREIGVRMALGATREGVLALILGSGSVPLLGGILGGTALAFALSWILESMLFEISARDLTVFVGAPILMICTALAAMLVPARHAALLDPVRTLTEE